MPGNRSKTSSLKREECVSVYILIYLYAYLDVPLVCKICAEIHQKNIHKRQNVFTYLEDPGIYLRIGLFSFVSFSCVFWLSIIMDQILHVWIILHWVKQLPHEQGEMAWYIFPSHGSYK